MSFRFAAPSLHGNITTPSPHEWRDDAPLEPGVVRQELVEVRHELVDRLAHVHVPYVRPHRIGVGQRRDLVLGADLGLELVPGRNEA